MSSSAPQTSPQQEIKYDLLVEHLDTLLLALNGPVAAEDMKKRVTSAGLARLERHGFLANDGSHYRVPNQVLHETRAEGMLSFLERTVLPVLAAMELGSEATTRLHTMTLDLDANAMKNLRTGPVQTLFQDLTEISDRPASGPLGKFSLHIVGTSRVDATLTEPGRAALEHTKRAALQRSLASERDLAILTQLHFLADAGRARAADKRLMDFVNGLGAQKTSAPKGEGPTYHLTVAYHYDEALESS